MVIRDENGFELVSHDPLLGRTVWSYFDGQATTYRTDYAVDNTIKDNKLAQAEHAGQQWGDGKRIASIPLNIYHEQLAQAQNEGDEKFVSRWLNDGDNAAFRVKEGQV